jgi:hypothetical protein
MISAFRKGIVARLICAAAGLILAELPERLLDIAAKTTQTLTSALTVA